MPAPNQTKCVLGGFTYPYNPVSQTNPTLITIVHTTTMQGGGDTIWTDPGNSNAPYFLPDQVVNQQFPLMDADFFNTLDTKVKAAAVITFVDWFGVAYHVLPLSIVAATALKGGAAVWQNVTLLLRVKSRP